MFAYCDNNYINNVDPYGKWTIGLSLGGNITVILGVSISIGVFFDDKGNADIQWSYAVPWVNGTNTFGALDLGVGITAQFTDRETVYDLYGPASYYGASGGPSWYVGADIISFADASDIGAEINGFQLTGGVGIGVDVHAVESDTSSVLTGNRNRSLKTQKQKRMKACYKVINT